MFRRTKCHPQGVRYFLLNLLMNVLKCAGFEIIVRWEVNKID